MKNKIKPCPFCGGTGTLRRTYTGGGAGSIQNIFIVGCDVCGVMTKQYTSNIVQHSDGTLEVYSSGADEAVDAWNKRV